MTATALVKRDAGAEVDVQAVASQIKEALADGRKALWRLAEALHTFNEMRGWRGLGYDNLSAWLEDTNGAITRGTYYRLVGTWRKTVVELKVDPERVSLLDQSKVAIVVDKLGDAEVEVDDAFADVEQLGAQALRAKYRPRPRRDLVTVKTPTEPSGRKPEAPTTTPATRRDELRDHLEGLASLALSLVRQEREGASARELEVNLMLLEGGIAGARATASLAVKEEVRSCV